MFIYDLEFIQPCNKETSRNDSAIKGGAFAQATVDIGRSSNNDVFARTSASSQGDYSRSLTTTGVNLIAPKNYYGNSGYSAGYASGYGAAYAVDRYSTIARDRSFDSSIF